ncbi:MAG: hypothetical protein CL696_15095 [Chloroflexi bacterium]|nr:hypothetical protein [Chloroflexota bacterium]
MGVKEPEQGHCSAESLAQAVAGFDRHPAVFCQGVQHFVLFGPDLGRMQEQPGVVPTPVEFATDVLGVELWAG